MDNNDNEKDAFEVLAILNGTDSIFSFMTSADKNKQFLKYVFPKPSLSEPNAKMLLDAAIPSDALRLLKQTGYVFTAKCFPSSKSNFKPQMWNMLASLDHDVIHSIHAFDDSLEFTHIAIKPNMYVPIYMLHAKDLDDVVFWQKQLELIDTIVGE